MSRRRAFTLIELLIVVAIIAILAAIAIPNFVAAQIRAKVAKVKADHRTIATAVEAYFVDYQRLPPWSAQDARTFSVGPGYRALTTPVAYVSNWDETFVDVFWKGEYGVGTRNFYRLDRYYEIAYADEFGSAPSVGGTREQLMRVRDRYLIEGLGPDGRDSIYSSEVYPRKPRLFISYDPTNGAISLGDIWRVGGVGIPSWLNGRMISP